MYEKIQQVLKNSWFDGILVVILGLIMLCWPTAAMKIVCIIAGIFLILLGGSKLLGHYSGKNAGSRDNSFSIGLIQLILGVVLLILGIFFIAVFFVIVGLAMIAVCIMLFRQAYLQREQKGPEFIASIVIGAIILIIGVIMIINPTGTASFLVQMAGIAAIIIGIYMLYTAYKEKR